MYYRILYGGSKSGETTNLFIAVNLIDLVNSEVIVGEPPSTRSFTGSLLVEKIHDLGKKLQAFDMAKTEEFLVKEKFITFPQDHQLLSKEEIRGKVYYKYHNS